LVTILSNPADIGGVRVIPKRFTAETQRRREEKRRSEGMEAERVVARLRRAELLVGVDLGSPAVPHFSAYSLRLCVSAVQQPAPIPISM
jgi:hypothetical protein